MQNGIPSSAAFGSSEPASIFPYRSDPNDDEHSHGLQWRSHSRALAKLIVQTHARRLMAHIIVAIAPFVCHVTIAAADGLTAHAQAAERSKSIDRFAGYIAEASARFAVPASWIRAVMKIESGGERRATSSRGALGLMQLMPGTWVELSARYDLGLDPFDPRDNILAGAAYLKEMHDRFGSAGFLAAYHAGPGRYKQHLVTGKPLPSETMAYVAAVTPLLDNEQGEHAASDGRRALPWREAPLFVERAGAP
ncbi:MAG: transglycosylase SLT domain-containing protein [Bradyrhizobium sp.]|uniref:transglycosylase SLT domain-containing protein n=1 Tax=Bradyrhizobium sp. TaxID=376 RepID=UPI0029BDF2EB|nr:transglycosylase SLT domain-containing protein [Bradyrhizobium sp.]MDX3971633.1 transglycosylase SLT domain-containing protein [Bradyrhizobium sp.]